MAKSSREPRRIIQGVCFDGDIGPVTASELLSMSDDQWGLLRDRLTDGHQGKTDGLVARCMQCGGTVFVSTRVIKGVRLPFFAHYRGGDPSCPWYDGRTIHPDEARASQYQGSQVSFAHDMLCGTIDRLLRLDSRYVRSTVEKYLPPNEREFGRYPDVYVELRGLPPFAIEIQLSNTFQTEISARCIHYEREGVALLWVLYGVDPLNGELPQSFRDVIRRHRGNAFILDREAISASHREKTLILKCYLKDRDTYDAPILVRLDELKFPAAGLPYIDDRIVKPIFSEIEDRRSPWFKFLKGFPDGWDDAELQPKLNKGFSTLTTLHQNLACENERDKRRILRLIAIVFSVVSTANGRPRNYATHDPNIRAMLNGQLNTRPDVQKYALLIEKAVTYSKAIKHVGSSVKQHLQRAKTAAGAAICKAGEPEWNLMGYLVPEIFDPIIREELQYLDALPEWAIPATQTASQAD